MKLSLILALASFAAAAAAQESTVRSAEIVNYGIYRVELTGQHIPMPSTGAGSIHPVSSAILVAKTNQIPAKVGTSFGLMFILNGTPADSEADVDVIVKHPSFKTPDGKTTAKLDKVTWRYRMDEKVGYTYTFDHDWEAVPGKWSIEIWWRGKMLTSKRFLVKSHTE